MSKGISTNLNLNDVLAGLRDGISRKDLAKLLKVHPYKMNGYVYGLVDEGLVIEIDGAYKLTDKGTEQVGNHPLPVAVAKAELPSHIKIKGNSDNCKVLVGDTPVDTPPLTQKLATRLAYELANYFKRKIYSVASYQAILLKYCEEDSEFAL